MRDSLLLALGAVLVLGAGVVTAAARSMSAMRRARLSADGRTLAPCPRTPNCVATDGAQAEQTLPRVPFTDAVADAQARARAALLAEPRLTIVDERAGYLRAEARSRVFRFVDDVEVVVDADARVFRFRSAARMGRRDFGVNRARMTRVSQRLRGGDRPGNGSR